MGWRIVKWSIAAACLLLTLATLATHEAYVLRHDDPQWRHLAPFRYWLIPHVIVGALIIPDLMTNGRALVLKPRRRQPA